MGEMRDRESSTVDVKFRSGVSLDEPLLLLPPELRAQATRATPLVTLHPGELDRLGAARMGRWFRLTLVPGVDVKAFLEALRRLDQVESAEPAPRPAPMEE
jgi:hypothetical protein